MKKIREFTQRGPHGTRYPFPEMAAQQGQVFQLGAGEDYVSGEAAVRRAAHQWADRHTGPDGRPMKAITSVPAEGKIEISFHEMTVAEMREAAAQKAARKARKGEPGDS